MTDRSRSNRLRLIFAATALLLLGAGLRFFRLDAQALSGDEAYSAVVWVEYSIPHLLETIALETTEPHPPLALVSVNAWASLSGDSVLALRMLPLLASMVTLACVYQIGWQVGGQRVARLGLLLAALNPFQIWYGQFARNYSLWMALSALGMLLMLRAWSRPERRGRWLAYVLTEALAGYIFYLEIFALAAHNLYALTQVRGNRKRLGAWALAQAGIGLLLAPWYLRPELRANSQDYLPNEGPVNILWAVQSFLLGDKLPRFLQHPAIEEPYLSLGAGSALSVVVLVGALVAVWRWRSREKLVLLAATSLTPLVLLSALTLVTGRGYFHPRYIAASGAPVVVLVAAGLVALEQSNWLARRGRWLAQVMVVALAALSLLGLWTYHYDSMYARATDWPAVMDTLNAQVAPGDIVLYNSPDPAAHYYFTHGYAAPADPLLVPFEALPDEAAMAADMLAATEGANYVWFWPIENPGWDPDQQAIAWLDGNLQQVSDQFVSASRLYQYADYHPTPQVITNPLELTYGNETVRLAGYRLTPPPEALRAGDTLFVELFWQPLANSGSELKSFVHLWGPNDAGDQTVLVGYDKFPFDGNLAAVEWAGAGLFRDVYILQLPDPLPDAPLTLTTGWYTIRRLNRLPLDNPRAGDNTHFALITEISPASPDAR